MQAKWPTIGLGAVLALVVASLASLPYWEGAGCGAFPWDDEETLARTAAIINGAASIWTPHLGNFHPITQVSWLLDEWVGRGNTFVYHVSNILLHALNAALVFLLGRRLLTRNAPAVVLALLFACHPIHVESTAWISERKNVLHALFYLGACLMYLNFLETGKRWTYAGMLVLFLASLLSKAQGVTMPLFLFGIGVYQEGWINWRHRVAQLLPLLCIAIVFAVVAISVQQTAGYIHTERADGLAGSIAMTATAFLQYPLRIVVPYDLSPLHPIPESFPTWQMFLIIPVLLIAIVTIAAVKKHQRVLPAILMMYTATVLPIIQIIPFGSVITADRYAYLASVPVLLGIVLVFRTYTERVGKRAWMFHAIMLFVVIGMLYMTRERVTLWCKPADLFAQATDRYPESVLARANLAAQYIKQGNTVEARQQLEKALLIDPSAVEVLVDLGQVAVAEGKPNEAIEHLTKAITLGQGYTHLDVAYYTRALAYKALNRPEPALFDLGMLLRSWPQHAKAWYQQGICFAMQGNHKEALASYATARTLGVSDPSVYLNQAISLGWLGDYQGAIAQANAYLNLEPGSADGLFLRGIAKQRSGGNGCDDLSRAASLGHARAPEALKAFCSH